MLLRFASVSALAVAGALFSTGAAAQDARDTHFDGPYISGFAGVAAQPSDHNDSVLFDTNADGKYDQTVNTVNGSNAFVAFCNGRATSNAATTGCSNDKDRVEYGGRIGYDMRTGSNFVIGALIEGSGNDILDGTTAYSSTPAFYEFTRGIKYNGSARLRAGYTPGGGALFYATGGISAAKINHRFRTSNGVNSFAQVDDDKWVMGWQAGGGAEVMITDHISLGLEYLFNRYNDDDYYVQVGQGTAGATNPFVLSGNNVRMQPSSENFTYHTGRATLSFQF